MCCCLYILVSYWVLPGCNMYCIFFRIEFSCIKWVFFTKSKLFESNLKWFWINSIHFVVPSNFVNQTTIISKQIKSIFRCSLVLWLYSRFYMNLFICIESCHFLIDPCMHRAHVFKEHVIWIESNLHGKWFFCSFKSNQVRWN